MTHSGVANLLKRLVEEGYVSLSGDAGSAYCATQMATLALEDWLQKPLSRSTVREELHARVASASPRHAALLYKALDTFERECLQMLDERRAVRTRGPTARSWRSLTINLTHAAADETLHGKIRWSQIAKRRLRDWLARSGSHRAPTLS
jgi:hypothetical protein